ncbi:hypothetical protein [Paratractidigestivibacter sp.]|uniref:hypothetical protein n=1 Tax=Paratractidigestivibacter sp. TaxID=2847316 RepID=UPI002ABD7455|nr:hypothetical protein [Paratractidigestivibacter sp.]
MAVDKAALKPGLFNEIGEKETRRLTDWMETAGTTRTVGKWSRVMFSHITCIPYLGGQLMCGFDGTAMMLSAHNDGTEESNALLERIFYAWNPSATVQQLDEWRGNLTDNMAGVDLKMIGEPTPSKEEIKDLILYGEGVNGGYKAREAYAAMLFELEEIDTEGEFTAKHWQAIGKTAPAITKFTPPNTRKLPTSNALKVLTYDSTFTETRHLHDESGAKELTRYTIGKPEGDTFPWKNITAAGKTTMGAIGSFIDAGVWEVPETQLYKFIHGRKSVSPQALDSMKKDVSRLMATPVTIKVTKEMRESGFPSPDGLETDEITTNAVRCTIYHGKLQNGRYGNIYRFNEMPALLAVAYARDQLTSTRQRSFERIMSKVGKVDYGPQLFDYIARRVGEMKHTDGNQMTYETIFSETFDGIVYDKDEGGNPIEGTAHMAQWGEQTRTQQNRFRKAVGAIMDGLQAEGYLREWYEYRNNGNGRGGERLTTTTKTGTGFDEDGETVYMDWYETKRAEGKTRTKADGIAVMTRPPKRKKKLED